MAFVVLILIAATAPSSARQTEVTDPEPWLPPPSTFPPDRVPNRFVTFVAALHDGDVRSDGVDDFLARDSDGLVIRGGQYDGLPVMRPTVGTIDGVRIEQPGTVIGLANQSTSANDGIWELFTDAFGVEGVFAVRTQVWNSSLSDDPQDYFYAQAGTPFLVGNGDRYGTTLWVTMRHGLATNLEPLGTAPLSADDADWWSGLAAGLAVAAVVISTLAWHRAGRRRPAAATERIG